MASPTQPPRATRPDGLWLDDLSEGHTFTSGRYEVTYDSITTFAAEFDPQPYHLDPDQAAGTFFDRIVASGWHTAAITMKLLVDALPIATGLIGANGNTEWPSPTLPGDILHVDGIITSITASTSQPGRASLLVTYQTLNQHHEPRFRATLRMLAWNRPDARTT